MPRVVAGILVLAVLTAGCVEHATLEGETTFQCPKEPVAEVPADEPLILGRFETLVAFRDYGWASFTIRPCAEGRMIFDLRHIGPYTLGDPAQPDAYAAVFLYPVGSEPQTPGEQTNPETVSLVTWHRGTGMGAPTASTHVSLTPQETYQVVVATNLRGLGLWWELADSDFDTPGPTPSSLNLSHSFPIQTFPRPTLSVTGVGDSLASQSSAWAYKDASPWPSIVAVRSWFSARDRVGNYTDDLSVRLHHGSHPIVLDRHHEGALTPGGSLVPPTPSYDDEVMGLVEAGEALASVTRRFHSTSAGAQAFDVGVSLLRIPLPVPSETTK